LRNQRKSLILGSGYVTPVTKGGESLRIVYCQGRVSCLVGKGVSHLLYIMKINDEFEGYLEMKRVCSKFNICNILGNDLIAPDKVLEHETLVLVNVR
jgi:hypothetical protein